MLRRHPILTILVLTAVLVSVVIALDALSGDTLRTRIAFHAQEWMGRHGKAAVLSVNGVPPFKVFLHPEDKVITPFVLTHQQWEAAETHWITQFVREGDTFVDLGANVGYYTLIASHLVGDEGKVFAFEPDPVNFSILERNVRLNGLKNVVLEQKAVSNEPGTIKLFLNPLNKGDHRIFRSEEPRPIVEVEAVRLDDYFAGYDKPIDFVKIDTQGAEGVILEGMDGLLRKQEHIVMAVEYFPHGLDGLGYKGEDVLRFLRGHDFMFFEIRGGGRHVKNFHLVDEAFLSRYTVGNKRFTNFFVAKGFAEYERLRTELTNQETVAGTDSLEAVAARNSLDEYIANIWKTHGRSIVPLLE
jgi:FkbM family methyltransferase